MRKESEKETSWVYSVYLYLFEKERGIHISCALTMCRHFLHMIHNPHTCPLDATHLRISFCYALLTTPLHTKRVPLIPFRRERVKYPKSQSLANFHKIPLVTVRSYTQQNIYLEMHIVSMSQQQGDLESGFPSHSIEICFSMSKVNKKHLLYNPSRPKYCLSYSMVALIKNLRE